MASTDAELISEARVITGYSARTLDDEEFGSVLDTARRHIRTELEIEQTWEEADWYSDEYREDALFWWSCLFSLVATGELDRQDLQTGAVESGALLAKDHDSVTQWFRSARKAMGKLGSAEDAYAFGSVNVTRENRVYGESSTSGTSTGGSDVGSDAL